MAMIAAVLPRTPLRRVAATILIAGALAHRASAEPPRIEKTSLRPRPPGIACPALEMRVGRRFPVTPIPLSEATGDFNNDGKLDVLLGSSNLPGVSLLFGDGAGNLVLAATLLDSGTGDRVAAADFNGDGNLDVAAWTVSVGLQVFLGDGAGGFTPAPATPPVPTTAVFLLEAADVDANGHADLLLVDSTFDAAHVTVLLGDGTGAFAPAVGGGGGLFAGTAAVADFDGDGFPDVAVPGLDGLTILRGDGAGGFTAVGPFPAGSGIARGIAASDFDGDGALDVAIAAQGPDALVVLLNDGGGGFGPPATFVSGQVPSLVVAGDFDGDGHADVLVRNLASANLVLHRGDGHGSFVRAPVSYAADSSAAFLAAADFNADGRVDAVVGENAAVDLLLADGLGGLEGEPIYPVDGSPVGIAVADLDGDGLLDVVAVSPDTHAMTLSYGQGGGRLGPPTSLPAGPSPSGVAAADFNGDGKPDLAVADGANSVLVFLSGGSGAGGFFPPAAFPVGSAPNGLVAADLDGDGKSDLAVANANSGDVSILLGDGNGGFGPAASIPVGPTPLQIVTADFNADRHTDLAVATYGQSAVSVLLNDGTGHFTLTHAGVGAPPYSVGAGDFNEDGFDDLVTVDPSFGKVYVVLGDGTGGFGFGTPYTVGDFVNGVAVDDWTGDGHLDWAVLNPYYVQILAGDGTGAFAFANSFPPGGTPRVSTGADLDGDGRRDLVIAAMTSQGTPVLLNDTFTVLPPALPTAGLATPYAVTLTQLGGIAPVAFALSSALPGGLAFDAGTATISGTPTETGSFPVTFTATDAGGCATSRRYVLTVVGSQTLIVVTSSASRSIFGQTVTLTATVSTNPPGSEPPTGTVTFTIDGVAQPPVPLVGGVATLTVENLSVGTHTVTASYSGDATHASGTSSAFPQIVLAAAVPALGLPALVVLAVLLAAAGMRVARG
jgi:hypothetical protein